MMGSSRATHYIMYHKFERVSGSIPSGAAWPGPEICEFPRRNFFARERRAVGVLYSEVEIDRDSRGNSPLASSASRRGTVNKQHPSSHRRRVAVRRVRYGNSPRPVY